MLNSEKEIRKESEDRLGRIDFADKLAKNIYAYENEESLTIGVIGGWGSGKSSLINLVLRKLEWRQNIIIIRFNPWLFSNQSNLYHQFFKILISTLKNKEIEDENLFKIKTNPQRSIFKKSEIKTLTDYFNYIDDSNDKFDFDDFSLSSKLLESYGSLDALKSKCDEYFEKLGYKIIVVIDDIDRLINEEIKQVFTLVKSLADFKNFIYILSFDIVVVSKALNEYHSDYKYKFLEKIVQIPIRVPDVTFSKMEQLIIEDIKPIYDRYSIGSYINDGDDFYQILGYLELFIKNVRDLKRFVNVLEFYLNGFVDDININDCFLILALQLFEYKVFLELRNNKRILTLKIGVDSNDPNNRLNLFYNEIDEVRENISLVNLKFVLENLFPMLKYQSRENHPHSYFKNLGKKHKIGNNNHFDKYFTFALENGDVSVNTLNKLLKPANMDVVSHIFNPLNDEKHNRFLFDELSLIAGEIPKKNSQLVILRLMKIGDELKILRYSRDNLNKSLDVLFKNFESIEFSCEIFDKCFSFENNIYTISQYIHHISVKKITHGVSVDELIFDEDNIERYEKLVLEKIKRQSHDESFFNHRYLSDILDVWRYYEDDKSIVKDYVISKTTDNNDLIEFLKKYKISDVEYSTEDFGSKDVFDFDSSFQYYFESLNKNYFDNLNDLNDRINRILNDENTSDNHKKFCEKFIEKFEELRYNS